MRRIPATTTRHPRALQSGSSLIEVVVAVALLAVGLLGHVASTVVEQRLARSEETRSEALRALEQFLERLRADDDWAGLHDRLRGLADQADQPGGAEPRLDNGRKAFPPATYYPDFVPPVELGPVHVLVDVPPLTPPDGLPAEPPVLREDVVASAFGLPADLNADGAVDGNARDADYTILPVVVYLRWKRPDGAAEEMRLATWLGGSR